MEIGRLGGEDREGGGGWKRNEVSGKDNLNGETGDISTGATDTVVDLGWFKSTLEDEVTGKSDVKMANSPGHY